MSSRAKGILRVSAPRHDSIYPFALCHHELQRRPLVLVLTSPFTAFLPIAAEAARQTAAGDLEQLLREDCPDPVTAGLLSEADAFELFEL
jgi:hypothetical protein